MKTTNISDTLKTRRKYLLSFLFIMILTLNTIVISYSAEPGPPDPPPEGIPGMSPPPGGNTRQEVEIKSEFSYEGSSVTLTDKIIKADGENTSAIVVSGDGILTLDGGSIDKSGDTTSDDNSNFYGQNATVLARDGGTINITGTKISSSANGANAIFATGDKSTINIKNALIHTKGDSSRGLDATYNGTVIASDTEIITQGLHCGGIATDRGEGTIIADRVNVRTSGAGSPGIYCTGNITVSNSDLIASGSEAAVIEGKNSITLNNVNIRGEKLCGVMLYQSFSGDAGVGTSIFKMTGGSLHAEEGPVFHSNNTAAVVELKNVKLINQSGKLIDASASRWGEEGSNGAQVTFNTDSQILEGSVYCDDISSISMDLNNNSIFTGTVDGASINLDKTSIWNLTGDSTVIELTLDMIKNPKKLVESMNIMSHGHNIAYDKSLKGNEWLSGKTWELNGGGSLIPR